MLEDLVTAGVEIEGTDQCCDHCNAPGIGMGQGSLDTNVGVP